MKLMWGPGKLFSDKGLDMHTTVMLRDPRVSGKASQYWKFDLESGGGRSGEWSARAGKMLHEGDYYPWLGRGAAIEGYAARIGWMVGLGLSAYDIGSAVYADVSSGDGLRHTIPAVSHEAFGWAGAIVGAEAFGEAGAALGALLGPPGIAVGGLVGGLIGGGLGFFYGSEVGDWVGQQLLMGGGYSGWRYDAVGLPMGGHMYAR